MLAEKYKSQSKLDPGKFLSELKEMYQAVVKHHGWASRDEQFRLSGDILKTFLDDSNMKGAFYESPTGTGKSLAVALASLLYARHFDRQIVIVTPRKDLQKAFLEEFGDVFKALPKYKDIKTCIFKGKGNYISMKTLSTLEEDYEETDLEKLAEKIRGLAEEFAGDVEEIYTHIEPEILNIKKLEDQASFGREELSLGWAPKKTEEEDEKDDLYYIRAKEEVVNSRIVITNHAMYSLHLILTARGIQSPLKTNAHFIIDEGHGFHNSLVSLFTKRASVYKMLAYLGRAELKIGTKKNKKALYKLRKEIKFIEKELANDFKEPGYPHRLKITSDKSEKSFNYKLIRGAEYILDRLLMAENIMKSDISPSMRVLTRKVHGEIEDLREFIGSSKKLMEEQAGWYYCFVVALSPVQRRLSFERIDMNLWPFLRKTLWTDERKGIVLSGTLADYYDYVNKTKNFGYTCRKLSLEESEIKRDVYTAPFNWKHVKVFLSSKVHLVEFGDDEEKNELEREKHIKDVCSRFGKIEENAKGGIVVLTPAYADVALFKKYLKTERQRVIFHERETTLYGAVKRYREDPKNSILITPAGWEGLDLPENDLTDLVITRIPFESPRSAAGIAQQLRSGSKYAFINTLNDAFIALRQGLGRLCRKETDRGNIYVFDRRLLSENPHFKGMLNYLSEKYSLVITKD